MRNCKACQGYGYGAYIVETGMQLQHCDFCTRIETDFDAAWLFVRDLARHSSYARATALSLMGESSDAKASS